jgi:hypothetical protein
LQLNSKNVVDTPLETIVNSSLECLLLGLRRVCARQTQLLYSP